MSEDKHTGLCFCFHFVGADIFAMQRRVAPSVMGKSCCQSLFFPAQSFLDGVYIECWGNAVGGDDFCCFFQNVAENKIDLDIGIVYFLANLSHKVFLYNKELYCSIIKKNAILQMYSLFALFLILT